MLEEAIIDSNTSDGRRPSVPLTHCYNVDQVSLESDNTEKHTVEVRVSNPIHYVQHDGP